MNVGKKFSHLWRDLESQTNVKKSENRFYGAESSLKNNN